ncbi:unnamed protein product [Prorocentrum cordatum]|nr:unnamed protein product [Polarella glacialis]
MEEEEEEEEEEGTWRKTKKSPWHRLRGLAAGAVRARRAPCSQCRPMDGRAPRAPPRRRGGALPSARGGCPALPTGGGPPEGAPRPGARLLEEGPGGAHEERGTEKVTGVPPAAQR